MLSRDLFPCSSHLAKTATSFIIPFDVAAKHDTGVSTRTGVLLVGLPTKKKGEQPDGSALSFGFEKHATLHF